MPQKNNIQSTAPAQNEVALLAYLNWEKSGKPANCADRFWIEAEAQLCADRARAAEADAKTIRQWPPVRNTSPTPSRLKKPSRTGRKSATTTKLTATRKHKSLTKKS